MIVFMMNTANAAAVTVSTHGSNLSVVTRETIAAIPFGYTVLQVWTWRGGECVIVRDWDANYGRGEDRAVVRTGGLVKGTVRTFWAPNFLTVMAELGIAYRIRGSRAPRRRPTRSAEMRRALVVAAHTIGNRFRTLRAVAA